nr:PQQ-binding-like beta-propeller repeat protein [Haladaptatus sp. W1]
MDESGIYAPVTAGKYLGVFDAAGERTTKIAGRSADISTPTVVDQRVTFSDGFRSVGVERRNWTKTWIRRLGGRGTIPTVVGDVAIVPISAGTGAVYAIDIHNGNVVWKRQTGIVVQPAAADESLVVLCESDGKILALNVSDGTTRWEASTELGTITTTPVLGNHLYVSSATQDGAAGRLEAYDVETGERAWKRSFDRDYITGTPAMSPNSGLLYCTTISGVIRALDEMTGHDVGRASLPTTNQRIPVDTSPVVAGGFLYITDPKGAIRAYSRSPDAKGENHLRPLWTAEFSHQIQSSPVVSSNALLALSSSKLVALLSS